MRQIWPFDSESACAYVVAQSACVVAARMTTSTSTASAIFLQAWDLDERSAVRAALQEAVGFWSANNAAL
jgi:hypothetical protein